MKYRIGIALLAILLFNEAGAQGLPSQTWPAGTLLADWPHGGRITTFHRGLLYLGGTENQNTWVYDISNPLSPSLQCTGPSGLNGHAWQKVGDLFYRQYWNPEVGSDPPADTSQFVSLANPCNRVPWTQTIPGFPHMSRMWGGWWMDTFPYVYANNIYDARIGWWPPQAEIDVREMSGLNVGNRFRIGNLLFLTPGDDQAGVAVFDIGNPIAPVLLDVLAGNYQQYTTAWQVWRHHLVLMIGANTNGPGGDANTLVVDFSDPTDLSVVWTIPYDDLPGRYVHFQDDYAFAGRFNRGVKYNMQTRQVERVFTPTAGGYSDFQWIPLGHLLLVSGSETNGSRSYLYAHQDGLDTIAPSVAYHLPVDGATQQPLATVIGLVIHETLDATTVNDQTIQLSPLGGEPLAGVVIHTSYNVINFSPIDPLQPDTTYEVRLVGNGVRDVAGNGIQPYSFFFSTGDNLNAGPPEISAVTSTPASPLSVGQNVQFAVVAEDPGGGPLEYRWTMGDGGAASPWSATPARSHTFVQPGVFTVLVQARNLFGDIASATLRVVVQPQAAAGAALSSTPIALDGATRRLWVVNPDHGTVSAVHADTLVLIGEWPACADPRSIAPDGSGRVWVACRGDGRLVALDAAGAVVAQTATGRGSEPVAVVVDPAGAGYVALHGRGEVIRFDRVSGTTNGTLAVGPQPEALALAGSTLFVSRLVSPDTGGEVRRIALPAFAAAQPLALALDSTTVDSGTAARGLPNYVAALAVSPDHARVWFAAKKDNILRGLTRDGAELDFETMVRVLLGSIDTAAGVEALGERRDIDNSALALGLAMSPGGAHLFVTLTGNDRVLAFDPWQGQEIARADTGAAPRGAAVDAATGRLFVRNDLGRSVSVFDAQSVLAEGATELVLQATVTTAAGEPLAPTVLAGKRVFFHAEDPRMSADGYIACASCHLDGGSDGRVWDFLQRGEGLRRTTTLKGRAGMAQGPVHWTANFDEIQDFETDIREVFGGTGFMANAHYFAGTRATPLGDAKAGFSAELDALADYASSLDDIGLSPWRNADGSLSTQAQAGQLLFGSLGCATCHGGADFTDSARLRFHDVGTVTEESGFRLAQPLQGLDTPTLRGLWRESRFLHDGRADDIGMLLTSLNTDGRHGATAGLSAADREALTAYLLSIDTAEPAAPEPFTLALASPAGLWIDPGPAVLAITSNLPSITAVAYLADGEVLVHSAGPPWSAAFVATAGASFDLQVRLTHASGAVTTTWPRRVQVATQTGMLFRDGFESMP